MKITSRILSHLDFRTHWAVLAALAIGFGGSQALQATTLYWDTNGATPGVGGTGTWDTSTSPNWSTSSTGGVATGMWNQAGGEDIGVFTGTIGGTVTISGTVNANRVQVSGTGYTFTGGALNLTGTAVLNIGAVSTFGWTLTGTNGFEKTGVQALTLTTNNSGLSGAVKINQGTINANAAGVFGSGSVTVANLAQLVLNGAGNGITNDIYLNGSVGSANPTGALRLVATNSSDNQYASNITAQTDARIVSTGFEAVLNGKISGAGGVEFGMTASASAFSTKTIMLTNTANDWTGNTQISSSGTNTSLTQTLKLGASNVISDGVGKGNVVFNGGDSAFSANAKATLDMNGFNETINGLQTGAGTGTNGIVTNNAAGTGTSTLTVGSGNASASFGGIIRDGTTAKVAVTKIGSGTQTLSAASSYTGTTTVSGGTLLLSGAGAISSSVAIDVANGAVLDVSGVTGGNYTFGTGQTVKGSGTITGNTTINGNLAPGSSPGLLTFSANLTLGDSATTTMEVGAATTRGTTYDGINVGNLLTYDGALSLVLSGTYETATWNLFDFVSQGGDFNTVSLSGSYVGSLSRVDDLWSGVVGGQSWSFDQATGDLSVVPEPGTAVLAGLGGLMVVYMVRRKRVS